ncbi:MAG: PQQ-binding-like beta-propeller repeat protein [Parvibaculaceae bacterium]
MRRYRAFAVVLALGLAGCSGAAEKLLEPFQGNDDKVLPGAREAVLTANEQQSTQASANDPVVIPTAVTNASWAQPGGVPSNAYHNLALGPQLSRVFSINAGAGSDGDGRLTASPIIVGGRVFVLDSQAKVRAFSAERGAPVWSTSLVPEKREGAGAYGGGLASDGSRVYATTAFGEVLALDAGSGAIAWRKAVDAPIRAAPTVSDGMVFVVTVSNDVVALSTSDGAQLWRYQGTGERAATISSSSPAVANGFVVVPSTSGEVTAFRISDGQPLWSDPLTSGDPTSSLANLNDVAGRPVIADGQVYAIAHAGRMAAFLLSNGEQAWSQDISGTQTPWVAGGYIFVISGRNSMVAISRSSGAVKWTQKLPGGGVWAGPVLGGGRLIALSSSGTLASLSPQTGEVLGTLDVGSGFYIAPVIANGMIYLLSDGGNLIAMR